MTRKFDLPKIAVPRINLPKISLPKAKLPSAKADDDEIPDLADFIAGEVEKVESEFAARSDREEKRFQDATDSEFWVAVCFQTRDQKEAFLKALGLFEAGDKYLDGIEVAEKLGIKIDRDTSKVRHRPLSKRLLGLT